MLPCHRAQAVKDFKDFLNLKDQEHGKIWIFIRTTLKNLRLEKDIENQSYSITKYKVKDVVV